MKIIVSVVLVLILGYQLFKFFRLVRKMKQAAVFPVTEDDLIAIRRQPKRAVDLPVLSHQKRGIRGMGFLLLLLLILVDYDIYDSVVEWNHYAILLLPLLHFNQFWNLFSINEDGVLCGGRFVPWERIRSYHFEELHLNHPAYYSPEVSSAYELKIKTKYSTVRCFVTSEEVKGKITGILDARLYANKRSNYPLLR